MAQEGVPGRTARLHHHHHHHHHLEVDVNQGCLVRGESRREGWATRGPRSLFLKRCDNGFGFTLRHFIVYPPESYTVLAGDRRLGLRAGALDEPMDTIFVKQVRAHSPAAAAGLKTGDRIVSVNGQTIAGRSYAQVVQLIHQSPTYLHLLVVPKEDDILQLYFGETAHHPETNQRPRLRSPAEMVSDPKFNSPPSQLQPQQTQQHHSRLSVHQRQTPWDDVRFHSPQRGVSGLMTAAPASVNNVVGRRSSDGFGMTQTEANPSSNYSSSESVPSSSPGSLYSYPSNTPGCRLSLDAGLIGRRESANSQDGSASSLDSTLRDPHSSDDSLIISRIRKSFEQKEEFLKRPAGPILSTGNVPPGIKEFYGRPQKLATPVWPPVIAGSPHHSPSRKQEDELTVKDKGFICGGPVTNVPNQDMKSMRSRPGFVATLGRIQENAHPIITQIPQHALVSSRAKQFEEGCVDPELPDRTSMYKSELARLSAKRSVPNVAVRKREFEARSERRGFVNRESRSLDSADNRDGVPSAATPLPVAFSGNRLVPVGSHKLHCEPPKDYHQPESTLVDGNTCIRPRSNSIESSWIPESWPQRHKAVRQDSYLAACHKPVSAESSGGDDDGGSTPLGSPNLGNIVWRDKSSTTDNAADDERTTRRVSYLKATWGDRMHVDSDPELSDSEPPSSHHSVLGDRNSLCVDDIGDKENQQITQEGLLHCKLTLVDGKRAGDRSWKQVWAVLRGPILCLYKERRDSIPSTETPVGSEGSNCSGGCGNEQIDVRCALVAAADNYTKRKHVLRVNTISGSELLLQAQDAGQMARWIVALQEQANNNNTSTTAGSSLSPVPAHKGIRKLTSFRNRSPTGQSPVNKTRKPTQNEPLSSPKSKTWKGRVAKQLRRIQQGAGSPVSPTAPHPPHSEGATIGIPLEDCPPSTVSEYVPLLVELCTGIVEARGLEIIGIYRVPGNTAAVSSLTEAVNRGLDAAILDQDQRWSDVNVISSLLKSFFRRLPDSLLTTELYPLFIQADKIEDPHLRMATIRKLVHDLPDHHYETLKYLLFHLKRVVEHCAVNKMEARNLAIVFGPTLVRTADDNMVTMVTDMSHQCRIVETLILHADWCFGDETVERLQLNPSADGGCAANIEGDPALTNHNLLLGNIHKVEGMKMDSSTTNREVTAKDIVSSIICAANRKMQKAKARKTGGGSTTGGGGNTSPSATEDFVDHHGSEVKQRSEAKGKGRKERLPSTAEDESLGNIELQQQRMSGVLSSAVASGIKESVVFSGNIANKLPSDNDNVAGQEVPDMETAKPATDNGTIRTYTGLSATTQERIRRFEMETKAMLHRDCSRSRREEQQRWDTTDQHDKERIDREWQQAKRELEADDILDRIADNPSAIVKKIVEPGGKSSVKLSSSTATVKPLAIVSPSIESRGGAEMVTRWGRSKELEARNVRRTDDGGGFGLLRRGSSAENVNKPLSSLPEVFSDKLLAPNGNLKRLKTGKEQDDAGLGFSGVRCGSLDSLHDVTISERPPSHVSDEGSDLLVSLTSTFDAKLRSLLSGSGGSNDSSSNSTGGTEASPVNQTTPPALFRDPSLHRAFDHKQTYDTTNKEAKDKQESPEEKEKNNDKEANNKENLSVVATQNSVSSDNSDKKQTDMKDNNRNNLVKLHRSESLNKTEEKNLDCSNKLRRSESLNKDSRTDTNNTKLKRSDSLTKNEKTESNLNKRRQLEAGRWNNVVKLKRKTGSTIDRSIKRRHTVGGTKDFDKVNWLDNRQREAEEEEGKKERRTSSPDLSSSRLAGLLVEVVLRPHSLADPSLTSRLCNVPLESHV